MLQGCPVGDWSFAFGTFAETLRIFITDVNDNTPLFLPVLETFGEQPGLVHPVGSSPHLHMLCHTLQWWGPSPSQGRAEGGAGARLGLLDAFHEGCGAKGSGGMLRALLSPGTAWDMGCAASLAAHQHDHTVHLSVPDSGGPRNLSCGPASGYCEGEELG